MVVVSVTLGPAILVVVMVLVSLDLVEGNGAHKFFGLFALGGANLAMSSLLILDFPFFCPLFLDLLEKGFIFVNGLGFEWNRLLPSLFFLLVCFYFLSQRREWFHPSTHGAAGCCFNSVIFSKCVDPLDCSHSYFHIYSVPGKRAPQEAKEKVASWFEFTNHSL